MVLGMHWAVSAKPGLLFICNVHIRSRVSTASTNDIGSGGRLIYSKIGPLNWHPATNPPSAQFTVSRSSSCRPAAARHPGPSVIDLPVLP
jgi:hypothetical protein